MLTGGVCFMFVLILCIVYGVEIRVESYLFVEFWGSWLC